MVHHPLYAEICGFIYGDERRVEASSADVTMGLLADADATDQQGGPLASLTFRPGDEQRALHSQSGAKRIEPTVESLVKQRVMGLCLGYFAPRCEVGDW